MTFIKNDLSYEKRSLTKDIALVVITGVLPKNKDEIDEFTKKAFPYKSGELAAQVDSCPVQKLDNLLEAVGLLKEKYEGFRIRHAELAGVAAVNANIESIDADTAEYLIASGSIAVIAKGYDNDADKVLLENGILPLVSDEDLEDNTFVFIRNIRNEKDTVNTGDLEAYSVSGKGQVPINISIAEYGNELLTKIL